MAMNFDPYRDMERMRYEMEKEKHRMHEEMMRMKDYMKAPPWVTDSPPPEAPKKPKHMNPKLLLLKGA